jgi:hypothetical protein
MSSTTLWNERPSVLQNLFNPAFCSLLLWRVVNEFGNEGLEFPLLFLILPFVLHKNLRRALPSTTRTSFAVWISGHPELLILIPELVRSMAPFTSEALLWAANAERPSLTVADGRIVRSRAALSSLSFDDQIHEVSECYNKAAFLGRWLRRSGSTSVVFALLGIRP